MFGAQTIALDATKRHEFVLLFDVANGNPNGDPDAANSPRVDPETSHGLVTDVAIKRKIRDYLALTRGTPIFIQSSVALNTLKANAAERLTEPLTPDQRAGKRPIPKLQEQLCADYYDIRMFGAVLATGDKEDRLNAGQVRGPVQFTFARSQHPVRPIDIAITRQARTTEARMETGSTEMGRKSFVPYGLYRAHGYFNPFLAKRTGVTDDDLHSLLEALANLFEFDRSASRGDMAVRGLYVFSHETELGNAHASALFDLVDIQLKHEDRVPRAFSDYRVEIDRAAMPAGVSLTPVVG